MSSLHGDVQIDGHGVVAWSAQRIVGPEALGDPCRYTCHVLARGKTYTFEIEHPFEVDQGAALALAAKVLLNGHMRAVRNAR